jgi:hypothetical protein
MLGKAVKRKVGMAEHGDTWWRTALATGHRIMLLWILEVQVGHLLLQLHV